MLAASFSRAQWEPDVRLTNDPAQSGIGMNSEREIVASGDTLHVVWYDNRYANYEIFYKRSTDGGTSWGADTRLTYNAAASYDPCLAAYGNIVLVVWADDRNTGNREIYYKRSEDGGSTWGADTRLTNAPLSSESPCIAISGSLVHVTWYDERNDPSGNWYTDIYYKRSADGGLTWGPDIRLTNKPNAYSGFPSVAVYGSIVHIVWEDYRDGYYNIYYKHSTDGGLTWGTDVQLTNDPADQSNPCIAISDSIVHVVWNDIRNGSNNWEIYYKRSTNAGLTWEPDIRLTNANNTSEYPNIAVSGSLVHVVWDDDRNIVYQIYYKKSMDGGISWDPETRLTNVPFNSQYAFVALCDSTVHVIWKDNRDGNPEIYYKRNPIGNILVGTEEKIISNSLFLNIYPNPASSTFRFHVNDNSKKAKILSIQNIFGKEVFSQRITIDESLIDISGLENGLYFVAVSIVNMRLSSAKLVVDK